MVPVAPHARMGLQQARRALSDGAPLPEGVLPGPIHRSWERTRAAGIRPSDRALFQHLVSAQEMRRVQDAHRTLIELALPDLEQLWRSIRSPQWVILLLNPEGTIVHSLGDLDRAPGELRMPLRCGRRLIEGELGTNAPGLVSSEPQPIEICGDEHFLVELRRFTCAAAPIFGLDGRVVGILDLSGLDVPRDLRAMKRVLTATRSIEARMFEECEDGVLVRMHEDQRFIGTPAQGLLLVREDGSVIAANRPALGMLGMSSEEPLSTLEGCSLFDDLQWLQRALAADASGDGRPIPVFTPRGFRLYLQAECRRRVPARASSRSAAPAVRLDPQWQAASERADRVFPHGIPILVQGETGVGKEVFARRLHEAHRPGKPFIAVNCAAIAEGVVESELFGHEEGAFTGSRKGGARGRIEQANGGTLFLDEIGDMPAHLQTRLLRVLQERSTLRVGGHQEIPLDILVVSASHRDLPRLVAEGRFREDLYFRLNGLKVRLPSLRERQDFDALVDACLVRHSDVGAPTALLQPLRRRLASYEWPGNIRQLQQALRVAALLAGPGGEITEDLLPEELAAAIGEHGVPPEHMGAEPAGPPLLALPLTARNDSPKWRLTEKQREWMDFVLLQHGGNVSAAAKALGISRTTFYKYRSTGAARD